MSVIAELQVAPDEFELGRIMDLTRHTTVELERIVPLGEKPVPFFRVRDEDRETFEESLQNHPSVESLQKLERHDNETLYALDWTVSRDHFFNAMKEVGAQLVSAVGTTTGWGFELRFPSHEALSQFKESCDDAHVDITVDRIYNPTKPGTGPWYGLSPEQRTTLVRAVRAGYYSIPRRISTKELAAEFDISDQAVTERLRRGIAGLVEHTLMVTEESTSQKQSE